MGTVSDLRGLAGAKSTPDAAPVPAPEHKSADDLPSRDKMTFADLGARIGEDNEALRNLLIDTSHQLSTIDDLKDTFGKLVDPLSNLLTTLEQERAHNAGSQGELAAIRTSHETLRAEFHALEKKSSELEGDNERLGRDLESAQQNARALEEEKAKLNGEVAAARAAMAMLVKQLGEEASNVRVLSEEKKLLAERSDTSDRRIVGLEAEIAHARERLSLLENDKDTLQAALDRTLAEVLAAVPATRRERERAVGRAQPASADGRQSVGGGIRAQQSRRRLCRCQRTAAKRGSCARAEARCVALALRCCGKTGGRRAAEPGRAHRGDANRGSQVAGSDHCPGRGRGEDRASRRGQQRLGTAGQEARAGGRGPDGTLQRCCRRR